MKREHQIMFTKMSINMPETLVIDGQKGSQDIVHFCMKRSIHYLKVINSIVRRVTVNVMDNLINPKFSPQLFFHKTAMQKDTLTVSLYSNIPVWSNGPRSKVTDKFFRWVPKFSKSSIMSSTIATTIIRLVASGKRANWRMNPNQFNNRWVTVTAYPNSMHMTIPGRSTNICSQTSWDNTYPVHKGIIAQLIQICNVRCSTQVRLLEGLEHGMIPRGTLKLRGRR